MGKNGYMALADENGVFKHLMKPRSVNVYRVFCNTADLCLRKRMADVPFSQTLTCPVCEEERSRWAGFWERQKELRPDE